MTASVPRRQTLEVEHYILLPALEKMQERIAYLLRYTHYCPVISGVKYSGKTVFLKMLQQYLLQHYKVQYIKAGQINSRLGLLTELFHVFELDMPHIGSESLSVEMLSSALKQHVTTKARVMLLDDCEHFSDDMLELIQAICLEKSCAGLIKLVLASDVDLLASSCQTQFYLFALPHLTQTDSVKFLQQYDQSYLGGRLGKSTDTHIWLKLSQQTHGRIGELAQAAQNHVFVDEEVKSVPVVSVPRKRYLVASLKLWLQKIALLMVMAVIGVAVLLLLFFQDEINQLFQGATEPQQNEHVSIETQRSSSESPQAVKPLVEERPVFAAQALRQNEDSPHSGAVVPANNTVSDAVLEKESLADASELDTLTAIVSDVETGEIESADSAEEDGEALQDDGDVIAEAPAIEDSSSTASPLFMPKELMLLAMNPEHYTLQLAVVPSEADAQQFLQKRNLSQGSAFYARKIYRDSVNYVVLYQTFPSRSLALAFLQQQPEQFKSLKPWVKTLSKVQDEIRQAVAFSIK